MPTLFTRKMIIPMWVGSLITLFASVGPPLTLATGSILAFMAVVPPTILLIFSTAPVLTLSEAIAQELRPADRSRERTS